jgi:predicted component of type VI protein secretion system
VTQAPLRCSITLLTIAEGANLGTEHRGLRAPGQRVELALLPGRRCFLGRGDHADVILAADTVSRSACYLELRSGRVFFTDESENGARVNEGAPFPRNLPLTSGDVIEIAPFRLLFTTD